MPNNNIENKKRNDTQEYRKIRKNKTVLDRYYERGYLDMPQSKFSAEDRKKAGEMLAYDFYMGRHEHLQAQQIRVINIPSTGDKYQENAMFYRDRYMLAMKNIPHEFWPAVRRVCIEDKTLNADDKNIINNLQNKNSVYFQKMLLNLGLNRLIKFYLQKNKKKS